MSELQNAIASNYDPTLKGQYEDKVRYIIQERFRIYKQIKGFPTLQKIQWEMCKRDPVYFCDYFVSTYDPRENVAVMPFILFPKQEELVRWLENCIKKKQWGTLLKSRDTGASFVLTMFALQGILFKDNFSVSLASNKADLVDKSDSDDTLFYKIDLMYNNLPLWMKTIDTNKYRKNMVFRNPETNSTILGQSGKNIGRGGRSTFAIVDEAAHIEADKAMIMALSRNTDCAVLLSTPQGKDNQFYNFAVNPHIQHFIFYWIGDPRRDPKWRQKQTEMFGVEVTAQELDCDFDASASGVFIEPKWVEAAVNAHLKIEGLAEISNFRQAGLDVAVSGTNNTILTIREGLVVESIDELPPNYPTQTALETNQKIDEKVNALCFDGDGVGIDIAGAINNLEITPSYYVIEFHGNGKAGDREIAGQQKYKAKDVYFNQRADAWGLVKEKIKRTYEHVTGIAQHNLHDLISIPNHPQLKLELSMPRYKWKSNKIVIESKKEMQERGLPSPDYADSLVYCFYEDPNSAKWILDL